MKRSSYSRRLTNCANCGTDIRTRYDEHCIAFCQDCKRELAGTFSECTNCGHLEHCREIVDDLKLLPCQPGSGYEFEKVRAEPWIMEMV